MSIMTTQTKLEARLDDAWSQKEEIERVKQACRAACVFELSQFAREVERGGGNPGLEQTLDALDDLINDMAHDAFAKLDEEIAKVSGPLTEEYGKQGVA